MIQVSEKVNIIRVISVHMLECNYMIYLTIEAHIKRANAPS